MTKGRNWTGSRGLLNGLSYFEYERLLGRRVLIPWLSGRMALQGVFVGDFGCHQGGVLKAFQQTAGARAGMGFEIDSRVLAASPFEPSPEFYLVNGDILDPGVCPFQFDLILLADVLEHIPNYVRALKRAKQCLRPGGRLFVSFPPYFSPFGGHQHVSANWARRAAYLHLLPKRLFFSLVRLKDNPYMGEGDLREDLTGIRKTRLTLARFEAAVAAAGLRVAAKTHFLIRPEFEIRYRLRPVESPFFCRLPVLREFLTTGAYYLLAAS